MHKLSGKQLTNRPSEEINITAEEILKVSKEAARGRNNTGPGVNLAPQPTRGTSVVCAELLLIILPLKYVHVSQLQSVTANRAGCCLPRVVRQENIT